MARLCFVSHDPDIFINEDALMFPVRIEEEKAFRAAKPPRRDGMQASVIQEFNRLHTIEELLERHGYTKNGKRYIRPGGTTPSVQLGGGKATHSSNDPLNNGHTYDAFEVQSL